MVVERQRMREMRQKIRAQAEALARAHAEMQQLEHRCLTAQNEACAYKRDAESALMSQTRLLRDLERQQASAAAVSVHRECAAILREESGGS